MHPIYLLYIILPAVSTFATPIAQRDGLKRINLSSHTGTIVQARPEHPRANADIALPPVAEVFAIMDSASSIQPPSSSTTTLSATTDVIHLGPGLVDATPTIYHVGISPTTSSFENTDAPHDAHPLLHKFLFLSVVVLSMIALILAIYAFSYHRHQLRTKKVKMAVACGIPAEKEKEMGRSSVVHITPNFPRSKFSVTSSDYPVSTRFSASTSDSESSAEGTDSDSDTEGSDRGLMNPAHFFALRASSMASRRHSRGGSSPVFGIPRYDGRREYSRRSRSMSGPTEGW
ncbi:hypothetical protein B0H11DRAFT_1946856 [Mycena galericulata]|nr:hypothetical protein B0H11DRAFT_1946856 [Mycena galericulata]